MKTPTRMAGYALGLAAVFAAALGTGRVVGGPEPVPPPAAHDGGGHAESGDGHDSAAPEVPGGLLVAQDGYRLVPVSGGLPVGRAEPFRFRVVGPDGQAVTDYTPTHDKDLHLIAVRRDLSGFQHVHPTMAADGTWSIPLAAAAPGQHRIFADFQPAARDEGLTLGVDVPASGDYRPTPLPAPAREATVDGYTVRLTGDLVPGTASKLTLSISRDGAPVTDLQPYLAAYGHLVALREGDLAYLHVHPEGEPGDGKTAAGPDITFYAEVPSAGAYRLFLDFQHAGKVRTAEFTAVAGDAELPPAPPTPGHDDDGHGHD
ncbi:hypothetical protein [Phytohabitans kaempferiae]|uniref:Secreted protein n=1 Tax=Phytohabitans kaempferiae TaxID=1620943 RepID=A0ABV6MG59_9ACTN